MPGLGCTGESDVGDAGRRTAVPRAGDGRRRHERRAPGERADPHARRSPLRRRHAGGGDHRDGDGHRAAHRVGDHPVPGLGAARCPHRRRGGGARPRRPVQSGDGRAAATSDGPMFTALGATGADQSRGLRGPSTCGCPTCPRPSDCPPLLAARARRRARLQDHHRHPRCGLRSETPARPSCTSGHARRVTARACPR